MPVRFIHNQRASNLLLGLAVLSLARLLLDVCCHGEGSAVMTVSQVDDVGNGRQHGSLAAGANDGVSLAHCEQELPNIQKTGIHDTSG